MKAFLLPPVQNLLLLQKVEIFWKKKFRTNLIIDFRKSHENWGQNNKPFKFIKKKTDKRGCYNPPVVIGLSSFGLKTLLSQLPLVGPILFDWY